MEELIITDVDRTRYFLEDRNKNKYIIILEFHDIEEKPKIGDSICFNKTLLEPSYDGYSNFYAFGDLKSEYGKNNVKFGDVDVIIVKTKEKTIYLKRLYG